MIAIYSYDNKIFNYIYKCTEGPLATYAKSQKVKRKYIKIWCAKP